ncbi:MAG: site-specific DNA-methyltransferase [Candidatus Hydrogenedentes bacterium]|nr:site-specific DNA-methyltransferase [Candidatus Hydrogenedentota bacterium]
MTQTRKKALAHEEPAGFGSKTPFPRYFSTELGCMYLGDSLSFLRNQVADATVDLIVTSPPFGLVRKKGYGNVDADRYVEWFRPFGEQFRRVLKPNGSLVLDIGGSWNPGQPTRSLYHFELLLMLCRDAGFHLAQDFIWWNPAKLPTPAEWVTVRRIRIKDAVDYIWWLSPSPWPRADNRRVLAPYSESMQVLLKNGYRAKLRPSGHDISEKFAVDNGAAIPPNLLAIPNTESNSYYLRYCREHELKPHPARFPAELPEYFVRLLTDPGDFVLDPFAGSCVTGEVAERLGRRWLCSELVEEYLQGAQARFSPEARKQTQTVLFPGSGLAKNERTSYRVFHPAALWNSVDHGCLPQDGGRKRRHISEPKSDAK